MARFVKLDLDQWEPPETAANPAKVANLRMEQASPGRRLAGLAGLAGLPDDVAAGIGRLKSMRVPLLAAPGAWPVAVTDAVGLASDGWVVKALALGWSPLDLFGAVTDRDGDSEADGLAVKLAGRRVLASCASFATVDRGNGGRLYLHRGNNDGARLLWNLR